MSMSAVAFAKGLPLFSFRASKAFRIRSLFGMSSCLM